MTSIEIYTKLSLLPDHLKNEVGDFVDFLKTKSKEESTSEIKAPRKAGLAKGLISMKEGYDEPLDDFKEYR